MQNKELFQSLHFVNNFLALINVLVWRDLFLFFLNSFIWCLLTLKIYYPNHTTTKVISTVGAITIFLVFAFRIFF
jgi:hypothetical protein